MHIDKNLFSENLFKNLCVQENYMNYYIYVKVVLYFTFFSLDDIIFRKYVFLMM